MDMPYRYLGRSGLKISALSFGSWVTFDHQMDVGPAKEANVGIGLTRADSG